MSLILGLDSGGTKTLAALADESGRVVSLIGRASLDPSAGDGWKSALAGLLKDLPELPSVRSAVFGLPFHGEIEAVSAEQIRVVRELMPIEPVVDNDVRIAFDGAFAGEAGALILAGTGSMAWASLAGPDDPHVRVGGWGDAFGDEGSAFWIGREALAATSRELDGRSPKTGFSQAVLSRLGVPPSGLLAWCYGTTSRRGAFASLAALVSELADSGDATARAILDRAAMDLTDTLIAAWRQAAGERPLRWSYAGGVTASPYLMQSLRERVGCEPVHRRLPPIGGALYRAAIDAGWAVGPAWLERLERSLSEFPTTTETDNQEA
ncbi:N-acetylglucosamine kinase [Aurantimonas sp. VKM B-3413]|uniref:N-acetylglucosamine kinase n=1 Tax=Aurantimonas sp. VKM B-3413 TaxID=2779401 RepID=UPI001E2944AA|nr:BadF/BadG/BcrA/BcrD ATPase family protein [Aurantimonas sp. VKM B-3413]MCB8836355.1 N-acetylglucosamine kinase [Aurantimonas sp. VKM B-3413]